MRTRKKWAAVVSLGAVLIVLVAGCAPNTGNVEPSQPEQTTSEEEPTLVEPDPNDGEQGVDEDELHSQALLDAAVLDLENHKIINEAVEGEEVLDGFGAIIVDVPTRTLIIRWKGEPPGVIDEVIARHPEITIKVEQTDFTDRELERAALKIIRELEDALDGRGKPNPISQRADGILRVDIQTTDETLTVEEVEQAIDTITPAPVLVTFNEKNPMELTVGTRQTDASPYYGGAGIRVPAVSNGYCTSGFAVKKRGNGKKFMTTAFHCIYNASQPAGSTGSVNSEGGQGMGSWSRTGARVEKDKDTALIEIPSNRDIKPRAYWDGIHSSNNHKIDGYKTNKLGDKICTGVRTPGAGAV